MDVARCTLYYNVHTIFHVQLVKECMYVKYVHNFREERSFAHRAENQLRPIGHSPMIAISQFFRLSQSASYFLNIFAFSEQSCSSFIVNVLIPLAQKQKGRSLQRWWYMYKRFDVERKTINFLQPLFFCSHLDYKWIRFNAIYSSKSFFFLRKKRKPKNCCKIPEILKVEFSCHYKTVFLSFYEFNKVGTDTAPNKKKRGLARKKR